MHDRLYIEGDKSKCRSRKRAMTVATASGDALCAILVTDLQGFRLVRDRRGADLRGDYGGPRAGLGFGVSARGRSAVRVSRARRGRAQGLRAAARSIRAQLRRARRRHSVQPAAASRAHQLALADDPRLVLIAQPPESELIAGGWNMPAAGGVAGGFMVVPGAAP